MSSMPLFVQTPRPTPRTIAGTIIAIFTLVATMVAAVLYFDQQLVHAIGAPDFKVVCVPQRMAPDDPIVFQNQPGKSHMHTFFGARSVDAYSTVQTLLANSYSACGANFGIDKSAYWVPSLYKNGQAIYATDGSIQLAVYYERAGGAAGVPVQQAFPQGLRIIAGDMHATTPQDNVWFKCAVINDSGSQSKLGHSFPSCAANEEMILELQFPDCWNGTSLDSTDHKSHMAYSSGSNGSCPADHPVKLPKITFEAWYHGVNGPASNFSLASGGPYTLHGDVMSAWDPTVFAGLVNECINKNADCTPLRLDQISMASVTQAQIDAQLRVRTTSSTTPTPTSNSAPTTKPDAKKTDDKKKADKTQSADDSMPGMDMSHGDMAMHQDQAVQAAADTKSNRPLYIGLGIGAIVVILGGGTLAIILRRRYLKHKDASIQHVIDQANDLPTPNTLNK